MEETMKRRLVLLAIMLIGAGAVPAVAQKAKSDPRPLKGVRTEEIPLYRSVEEFMRLHPGSGLSRKLVSTGTAQKTPLSAPHMTLLGKGNGDALTPLGLSPIRVERSENGTARWINGALGTVAVPSG